MKTIYTPFTNNTKKTISDYNNSYNALKEHKSFLNSYFGIKPSFKDTLLNNTIYTKYPYMKSVAAPTYSTYSYVPKSNIYTSPYVYNTEYKYTPLVNSHVTIDINHYFDYSFYTNKLKDLKSKLFYAANPTYDFKLADGTPVKINGHYMIIGTEFVPFAITEHAFSGLSKKTINAINDIFIFIDENDDVTVYAA